MVQSVSTSEILGLYFPGTRMELLETGYLVVKSKCILGKVLIANSQLIV